MIRQSKLKLTIGLILVFLIEAIISAFAKGFPFTELVAAQGLVGGWYLQKKNQDDATRYATDGCADAEKGGE